MYKDEAREQEAFVNYIKARHPYLIFSANISGTRRGSKLQRILNGKEAKRLGYLRGIPDITIYRARNGWNGLLIEMKSLTGSAEKEQRELHERLEQQGYKVAICKGWQKAVEVLEAYLK